MIQLSHPAHAKPRAARPMELMTAIHGRRAVRDYTHREVPRDILTGLVDAAVQAPSALNHQPWSFGVFRGRSRLEDFGERAKMHFLATFTGGPDPHVREHQLLLQPGYKVFHGASALIVIYAKPGGGQFAIGDCCLAAQNLMLAAHGLGLGTCPIGFAQPWLDLAEVKSELGIAIHYTAVLPIVVGYPAGPTAPPGRHKPEFAAWL